MSETLAAQEAASAPRPARSLPQRLLGVLVSPRDTYARIVEQPRAFGALVVVIVVIVVAQGLFLSTEVGQDALMDQQIRSMEAFGVTVSDEMVARMEEGLGRAPYFQAVSQGIFWPLAALIVAALLMGVFTMLLGGAATFKQVFTVVAHSAIVLAVAQLFAMPLSYVVGEFTGASLGALVPMLEETSFVARFLAAIDFFFIWWIVNLAIGIGVLYKRRTGPIASGLMAVYVAIALLIAFVRSGS